MQQKTPHTIFTDFSIKKQEDEPSFKTKLRKISKEIPKLDPQPANHTNVNFHKSSQQPQKQKNYQNNRIQWKYNYLNHGNRAHKIPQAERFPKYDTINTNESQLLLELRENLNRKGITFAKSPRKKLFQREQTPSAADYRRVRYLQKIENKSSSLKRRRLYGELNKAEHICGGTINRFTNYDHLYYPHTKRLQYNEKQIKMKQESRKAHKSLGVD